MAIIDIFVGNVDRHLRNLGVIYNSSLERLVISPIFDCGMGLFENEVWLKKRGSFEDCYNNVYIEPYGDAPIDLLNLLDKQFGIRKGLRDAVSNLNISKQLFPTDKAYKYYTLILREFRHG